MGSKEYQKHKKLKTGPGGLGCQCCNPYHCYPRNMKALSRRLKRRNEKQEMKKENW